MYYFRALTLLMCIPMSGIGALISGGVACAGGSYQTGSGPLSCSSPAASASAVFTAGILDVRVDTAANNPDYARAWLHYDAMFNLNVSGSGTGFIEPIMVVNYTPDPAISSYALVSLGSVQIIGGSTYVNRSGFSIPITFGVNTLLELKLEVDASTGFALFPPSVSFASSYADASLQDLWVLDQSGHRTPGTVTFTEVVTPEPSYTAPVFVLLAFAAIGSMIGKRRWLSR